MNDTRELGRRGESWAADWLTERGMRILDANWRCPRGEIDLVVRDGDELVVVEVKTRRGTSHGHALEAVTPVKAARLRGLAHAWREAHPAERGPMRIDVVGITVTGGRRDVRHVRGIEP
ncbi:YraN family protein [Frigoribacterium salinisoli]